MEHFLTYLSGSTMIAGYIFAIWESREETTPPPPGTNIYSIFAAIVFWPVTVALILMTSENETIERARINIFYRLILVHHKIKDAFISIKKATTKLFKNVIKK